MAPEAPGCWVTLYWNADSEHPGPEVVGPYPSHQQAVAAVQESLLIDSFCEDNKRDEWLDDVGVDPAPASITRMCADYGHRVTLIDPGDPNHFGGHDAEPPHTGPSGLLQAGALDAPTTPPQCGPTDAGVFAPGGPVLHPANPVAALLHDHSATVSDLAPRRLLLRAWQEVVPSTAQRVNRDDGHNVRRARRARGPGAQRADPR